jgi:hypothetical protein
MASDGVSLLIKELALFGVPGASEVLVFTEPALGTLEMKRALIGAEILPTLRPAPPILKRDISSFILYCEE